MKSSLPCKPSAELSVSFHQDQRNSLHTFYLHFFEVRSVRTQLPGAWLPGCPGDSHTQGQCTPPHTLSSLLQKPKRQSTKCLRRSSPGHPVWLAGRVGQGREKRMGSSARFTLPHSVPRTAAAVVQEYSWVSSEPSKDCLPPRRGLVLLFILLLFIK